MARSVLEGTAYALCWCLRFCLQTGAHNPHKPWVRYNYAVMLTSWRSSWRGLPPGVTTKWNSSADLPSSLLSRLLQPYINQNCTTAVEPSCLSLQIRSTSTQLLWGFFSHCIFLPLQPCAKKVTLSHFFRKLLRTLRTLPQCYPGATYCVLYVLDKRLPKDTLAEDLSVSNEASSIRL